MTARRRQPRPLASEPRIESPYLTAKEAAVFLRFASARALYKAITYGVANSAGTEIPYVRRGRTLLFHRAQLDRWLAGESRIEILREARTGTPAPLAIGMRG